MLVTVVDTETTGLDPKTDQVCEVALVRVDTEARAILSKASSLCSVTAPMSPEARGAHHIDPRDLVGKPTLAEALRKYLGGISDPLIFAAHYAPFDEPFLAPHLPSPAGGWICTYRCARHLWPDAPAYGNQTLRYWRDLEVSTPRHLHPHRALYDAIVTASILLELTGEVSVDRLIELTTSPVLLTKVTFGKYAGLSWSQVPKDYLRWLLGQDFDEDTRHTARTWLTRV